MYKIILLNEILISVFQVPYNIYFIEILILVAGYGLRVAGYRLLVDLLCGLCGFFVSTVVKEGYCLSG